MSDEVHRGDAAAGGLLTGPRGDARTVPPPDPALRAIVVLDLARDDWPVVACTAGLEQVTGFRGNELLGRPWPSLWSPEIDATGVEILAAALASGACPRVEISTLRRDEPPVETTVSVVHGGGLEGPIAVLAVQPHGSSESAVAYLDALTRLPNRALLERDLDVAILRAIRTQHSIAVLFCDLNRFKPVNDELGHAAGDAVLREVARRLRATVRAHDLVTRYGGDEFVIVLTDLDRNAEMRARTVAKSIRAAVARPIAVVDGISRSVGVSVGLSVFPRDAEDAGGLLATADRAMYRAKRADRFPATPEAAPTREALLERARAAQLHSEDLRATAEANVQEAKTTLAARGLLRGAGRGGSGEDAGG